MITGNVSRWAVGAAAAALLSAVGLRAAAVQQSTPPTPPPQVTAPPPDGARTTAAGVYSAAQASRGEQTFSSNCMGCHTTSAFTNAGFRAAWNGKPVLELYAFIAESMPEDFPGALAPKEYAQVMAYLLKLNGAPAGEQELPSDAAVLKTITLDLGTHPGHD